MPYFISAGQRLFYRAQGTGDLFVILPGNTATSACHQNELDYFSARYHAVSIDFRGTGQSDRVAEWPTDWFQQNAHDVAALIEQLGADRAIVLGTSGGAGVALWTAILHPNRVRAVIADSEIEVYPPDLLRALIAERSQPTPDQVNFWKRAQGDDWEQVVAADSTMLLQLAKRGGDLFQGQLNQVMCPVLLTLSLADELLPEPGQQACHMAQQIPDSRLFFATHGGHPLMWSNPAEFRPSCDAFLKRLALE